MQPDRVPHRLVCARMLCWQQFVGRLAADAEEESRPGPVVHEQSDSVRPTYSDHVGCGGRCVCSSAGFEGKTRRDARQHLRWDQLCHVAGEGTGAKGDLDCVAEVSTDDKHPGVTEKDAVAVAEKNCEQLGQTG